MELKGHTAGVYHFSFSADSTRYSMPNYFADRVPTLRDFSNLQSSSIFVSLGEPIPAEM